MAISQLICEVEGNFSQGHRQIAEDVVTKSKADRAYPTSGMVILDVVFAALQ